MNRNAVLTGIGVSLLLIAGFAASVHAIRTVAEMRCGLRLRIALNTQTAPLIPEGTGLRASFPEMGRSVGREGFLFIAMADALEAGLGDARLPRGTPFRLRATDALGAARPLERSACVALGRNMSVTANITDVETTGQAAFVERRPDGSCVYRLP